MFALFSSSKFNLSLSVTKGARKRQKKGMSVFKVLNCSDLPLLHS